MKAAAPQAATGTFMGIGGGDGPMKSLVGNDGSLPDKSSRPPPPVPAAGRVASVPPPAPGAMRPRTASVPNANGFSSNGEVAAISQPPPVPSSRAPHPAAIVRTPGIALEVNTPANARSPSRPDGQDGSIPAYGSSLKLGADDTGGEIDARQAGGRRKGSVAVWIMAFLLAAVAIGGVAFFYVKKNPLGGAGPDSTNNAIPGTDTPPPPTTTIAPPPPTPTPSVPSTPTSGVLGSGPDASVGAKEDAGVRPGPTAINTGRPVWVPRPPTTRPPATGTGPDPAPTPTTTQEPPPKPAPTLAPDPFGTPE
jgi:hypothetical protein